MEHDDSLTDRDLVDLRAAVYGGPRLAPDRLAGILAGCRLPTRGRLQAIRPPVAAAGVVPLHPDLWIRATGDGEAYACPGELVAAIQRAVVRYRLERLRSGGRRSVSEETWERERELRALALAAVRRGDAEPEAALRLWWRTVCLRHVRKLDAMRRKLLEFVALLSQDLDEAHLWSAAILQAACGVVELYDHEALEAHLLAAVAQLEPVLAAERAAAREPAVRCALERIAADFDQPLTVDDLADEAGVSRAHLMRVFKRACGRTINEHLRHQRIEHAKELLRHDGGTLLDIATASGFGSQEHFQRTFKRVVGITPGRYRG